MKAISPRDEITISGALERLDDVINTLTLFAIDEDIDCQTLPLLRLCRNQLLREVNALNGIFKPEASENKQ